MINLFDCAEGKICLVEDSGTTTLGPILSDLAGVLCTTGTAGSHLAIVLREFEIPCILGLHIISDDKSSLNGKKCKIVTVEEDNSSVFY